MSEDMQLNERPLSATQMMISSCTGALLTSIFMTPMDVVKVRLQAQHRLQLNQTCFLYCNGLMDHICNCVTNICNNRDHGPWYNRPVPVHMTGTFDALVKISQREGLQSLWSGLPPTLVIAVPSTVIYFTSYDLIRDQLRKYLVPDHGMSGTPPWVGATSGGLARTWCVTLVAPFELVRTKLQSQNVSYRELWRILKNQLKMEGIISLWRGWVPTILRDVPFSIMYWASYESLKNVTKEHKDPSLTFTLVAGAISGGFAGTITLPLDVVKTHRQIELGETEHFRGAEKLQIHGSSSSTWQILQNIYRKQRLPGLFSGLTPRLFKVMPACAIMISSYEYAKTFFRKHPFADSS